MNIFKKIYCRSFQTVFKIALPFLPCRMPKIVSALSDIPSVLNKKKKSCPIIITDPGIAKLGILSMLTDVFDNAGIEYHVYDKTVANPTTDTVEEALAIYKDNKCVYKLFNDSDVTVNKTWTKDECLDSVLLGSDMLV